MLHRHLTLFCLALVHLSLLGQSAQPNFFQPFTFEWPAANAVRLASGAPGPGYWQQRADYKIEVSLDEVAKSAKGSEVVTYHNQSPHTLTYLWVQLDQESRKPGACAAAWQGDESPDDGGIYAIPFNNLHTLDYVQDAQGKPLKYQIVETSMRIDLPTPLAPGQDFTFAVAWHYLINDATIEGRSGYEAFPDGNHIFEMAQWFPRMCVYDDTKGWQNRPFYGPAEFALEFGNYDVAITVPEDHLVSGTGNLVNPEQVLSADQRSRLATALAKPGEITVIANADEARANMADKSVRTKTWHFRAENVRDFAWASSRRFIWDASSVDIGGKRILAQSFYPPEALGLWDKVATHSVMQALTVYSKYSVDYPYPHATAVNGPVWGMEYPMVAFCGGRPEAGGVVTSEIRNSTISVIIHEVGHNFFPMIVNSDERRWAWMDEGFNSFLQFLSEQEWEEGYPSRRGFPENYGNTFVYYSHNPIMTNPESIAAQGKTTYEKTAVGLNILRETVLGREVFDRAFKEYCQRWAFKHPEPWDFFRTMSDAGGKDLDWFWRVWFYRAEITDMAMVRVIVDAPEGAKPAVLPEGWLSQYQPPMTRFRNARANRTTYVQLHPELKAASGNLPAISNLERTVLAEEIAPPSGELKDTEGYLVHLQIERRGIPMPVPFGVVFEDGTQQVYHLPAQIWMRGGDTFSRTLLFAKPVAMVILDPLHEIPDADRTNDAVEMEWR
jgi:hypothetical protein